MASMLMTYPHSLYFQTVLPQKIEWGRLANLKFKPAILENICFKFDKTFRVL